MKFSQILDELMKSRNISNYEMSKKTGISDSLIGYWRKGERVPKADNLLNISNFLEVSTDYLLGRTDEPQNNILNSGEVSITGTQANVINNNSISEQDEMSAELLKRFKTLSFDEKLEVFNYIKNKS